MAYTQQLREIIRDSVTLSPKKINNPGIIIDRIAIGTIIAFVIIVVVAVFIF